MSWFKTPDTLFAERKQSKLNALKRDIDAKLLALCAKYPDRERETWHEQYREAVAYPNSPTPFLDTAAAEANLTTQELVDVVLANASAWSTAAGAIVGERIRREKMIQAAETMAELEPND